MTQRQQYDTAVVDLSDINPHILFNNDNSSNDDDQKNTKTFLLNIISCVYVHRRGKLDVLLL
jgi:hypothetical protein